VLYVDSSALIKHYVREVGTDALNAKLSEVSVQRSEVFISKLGYAEILATFARRVRENPSLKAETDLLKREFEYDWALNLNQVELDAGVLLQIPRLVTDYPLKAADAIHLASALRLRDALKLGVRLAAASGPVEFAASDKQLKTAATAEGFPVFDPERQP
jgi:predicted nucleic acid-binding protein